MTRRTEYVRRFGPWVACIAVGIAAGGLLGAFIRDAVLEGTTAEYVAYGWLDDAARLEYDNAPAAAAIGSTNADIAALEECRTRPKHKYPCEAIPLVRAYAMLVELNSKVRDSTAASEATARALRACTAFRRRNCTLEDLQRFLPARHEK